MYFFSKKTLVDSFNRLAVDTNSYETEFFYFLLLKHAGISTYTEINLTSDTVKSKIVEAAKDLAWLFIDEDNFNDKSAKNNFINPLSMSSWKNQPTEPLSKWAPARLVNNITGGGKQWKKILIDDGNDPNIIKLKHDYLDFFSGLEHKYPLEALATWLMKFRSFDKKIAISEIRNIFINYFNISEDERKHFFASSPDFSIEFQNEPVQPHEIRSLVGNPPNNTNWLTDNELVDVVGTDSGSLSYTPFDIKQIKTSKKSSIEYLKVLEKAEQALLMGPPGTSKSYFASEIAKYFTHVKRIQFHPQYSYQDFIGGKILQNGDLVDKKGEFLVFLEEAMTNNDESYLLIIEEINRANVSQVFGELIQLLDKGEKLTLVFNDTEQEYYLPKNFKIIGTMNTTDRTVGRIDYAIKRRFYQIHFGVDSDLLVDQVQLSNNEFSIADLLDKINTNLINNLNNKEMILGHALFLKKFVLDQNTNKFIWPIDDFTDLFNYVVLPIIEDYCNGNSDLISSVIGSKLAAQLTGSEFVEAVNEYLVP